MSDLTPLADIPAGCLCTWTPDNPAASPLYRRWGRQPGAILPPCPVHPDPPQNGPATMSPLEAQAKLVAVLGVAGFWIESLVTDRDSPWYGGVEVCVKADPARLVVVLRTSDGYKARASDGYDYVGEEPVALVKMVLRQGY